MQDNKNSQDSKKGKAKEKTNKDKLDKHAGEENEKDRYRPNVRCH